METECIIICIVINGILLEFFITFNLGKPSHDVADGIWYSGNTPKILSYKSHKKFLVFIY